MKTFYLTTPIYYPNARPHVGSAYTTIVCDVIARYKRMCGYDVAFLTGTDEHGEKLERAAAAEGLPPHEFVAEKRKLFIELWKKLGIDNLRFVYTDQRDHITTVWRMLQLAQKHSPGAIYKGKYEGRYCVSDERYVSDTTDPVNCDICGRPAELISEENYFFRLSDFQERLLKLYEDHPEFVQPDFRRNEVLSFVKGGLRDISISRKRLQWGIPWPDDPDQVFYVWYDALTSYMTGIGYAQNDGDSDEFKKYWRNKPGESEIVHMIGKDILRFHAVYWPAFIMAAYPNQPEMLPTTVFAHGWIYYEQDKMSKSKGNVVYPEPIIDAIESFGAPGNDALRYYLLREAPFGQDTSFSYDGLIQRFNSDLANDLGNLASRTVTMINRYFGGEVPRPRRDLSQKEDKLKQDVFGGTYQDGSVTVTTTGGLTHEYMLSFDRFQLHLSVGWIWTLVSMVNGYLVEQQPWTLAKSESDDDRSLLSLVLYTAADMLRTVTILLCPILPESSKRLWEQLGGEGQVNDQRFDDLEWGGLKPGTKVGKPTPIFPAFRNEKREALVAKIYQLTEADRVAQDKIATTDASHNETSPTMESQPEQSTAEVLPAPSTETATALTATTPPAASTASEKISIEDFAKVDMRVGEILAAEPIPGAKKLLKLQVDIGTEVRQVCAGIAEHYQPDQLVGMKVVLVANLQPRKLRGIESNGMIVAASVGEDGKPVLATFKEDVPKGARLK